MKTNVSLIIRYSDKFGETVALHNEVSNEFGTVWFGKMGKPMNTNRVKQLEQQISENVDAWLMLAKRTSRGHVFHRAKIISILQNTKPESLFPQYYSNYNLLRNMQTFLKIGPLASCPGKDLDKVRVASKGTPIHEVLARSMNGLFIVENPE